MLHPNQFKVNEAWIAFQLNDEAIVTERDGSFNCVALMDAASCFILGTGFVAWDQAEPTKVDARRLLKSGWEHKKKYPITLFVPKGQFQTVLPAEAKRHGISVVPVEEMHLLIFIAEAREGFREHMQRGGGEA